MRSLAALALAFSLAGCAASGSDGKLMLTSSVPAGSARLIVYRPSGHGAGYQPDYVVDGRRMGASLPNTYLTCDLVPGRHEVSVANSASNMSMFGGRDRAVVDLAPGTTTYVQAHSQAGVSISFTTLRQVSDGEGRADTEKLQRADGQCQ